MMPYIIILMSVFCHTWLLWRVYRI